MSAAVGPCPSLDELDRLLSEQLAGSDRDVVEAHVEICSSCQDRLDSRIGASPAVSLICIERHADSDAPEPRQDFLDRLKQRPTPTPAWQDSPADSFGQRRIGQYEILGKLGQGGMGAVYRARHLELGKLVALKVLPNEQMYEVNVARFKREIRAIGQLEHPNIVTAHDAGQDQGVHYLAMSLVDGIDLAQLVGLHGPLPISDACELARQAAIGLQHILEQGLVHRDVKPCNLMLARDGQVKLLDLGLARVATDLPCNSLTMSGTLLGTADYLAPEQWDHPEAADTRADIYSLGCTLYHLLAGRPPFADAPYKTVLAKMQAHQQTPPPSLAGFRSDVPAELTAVLNRMLAKNPADRFGVPADAAAALKPFTKAADLPRLIRAHAASSLPAAGLAHDTAKPWQAALDTSSARPAKKSRARSRGSRPALWAAGVLAAAALLWAECHVFNGVTSGPAVQQLEITDVQVTHWNKRTLLGELTTNSRDVQVEDGVQISAKLSVPAYYYVIAFNPPGSEEGIEQLCYPADLEGMKTPAVPPPASKKILCPLGETSFVPDVQGLTVLVIAASTKPLPAYADWRKRAGDIRWHAPKDGGDWRGQFNGHEFLRFGRVRGKIEPREHVPQSFVQLCEFFKALPEFEAIYAIAIPVKNDKK